MNLPLCSREMRVTTAEPGPTDGASEALRREVPIYGGISKTTHAITQIWYPSSTREIYLDQGVLTGAYNFGNNARMWGGLLPEERLLRARNGAEELAGNDFAASLHDGITIAWQNIQHIEGGWAQWQNVSAYLDDSIGSCMNIYNTLACGDRGEHGNWFLICGDQLSQLPGWQEGAVMSALNVINLLTDEDYVCPTADSVPDSRLIVEGRF